MKKIIFLVTLAIPIYSNAFITSKIDFFECPSREDASECNSKCKKNGVKGEFKVDLKQKKVMIITYESGKQRGSAILGENEYRQCIFFDNKNWECKSYIPPGKYSKLSIDNISMANGIYFQEFVMGDTKTFSCGK